MVAKGEYLIIKPTNRWETNPDTKPPRLIRIESGPILDMGINNGEPVEVTNPLGIKHALADRNIWGGSCALYFDPFGRYWSGNGNDYEILWRGFDLDEANRNLISIVNGNRFDL